MTSKNDYTHKNHNKKNKMLYKFSNIISLQITWKSFSSKEYFKILSKFKKMYLCKLKKKRFSNLKVCYPNLFTNFQRLKNELQFICGVEQLSGTKNFM